MTQLSRSRQTGGLFAWLLLTFSAAAVGGFASANAGAFYQQLIRPEWAPPGWLFAPVWSVLYLLMGVAVWLVWRVQGFRQAVTALALYMFQLAANALWTWMFFAWHLGALAFIDILLLWGLILATIISFWRVQPLAGALLLPYLAWVTFASALSFSIWKLNPHLLV